MAKIVDLFTGVTFNPHRPRLNEKARVLVKLREVGWESEGRGAYSLRDGEHVFYVVKRGELWEVCYYCPECEKIHHPRAYWDDPIAAMSKTTGAIARELTPTPCALVYRFQAPE